MPLSSDLTHARCPSREMTIGQRGRFHLPWRIGLGSAGLLLVLGCSSWSGHALTEYEVPAAVWRAFRSAHPQATEVSYREQLRKGVKLYQIRFNEAGVEQETELTVDGKPPRSSVPPENRADPGDAHPE